MESQVRTTEAGDVEHVTVVDGAYLVLATIPADLIASRVENATNRGDVVKTAAAITSKTTVAELDAYADEHDVPDYPADGSKAEKYAAIEAAGGAS